MVIFSPPFMLRNRKPNQAVLPSLLQMVTPRKPERTRRSSISSPTTVQDPSHPHKPQKQRTTKRSSITLSSTSQASDRGRPRDPRACTQSMLKSSSTEGLLARGLGSRPEREAGQLGRTEGGLSLSLSLSLILRGWVIPSQTLAFWSSLINVSRVVQSLSRV